MEPRFNCIRVGPVGPCRMKYVEARGAGYHDIFIEERGRWASYGTHSTADLEGLLCRPLPAVIVGKIRVLPCEPNDVRRVTVRGTTNGATVYLDFSSTRGRERRFAACAGGMQSTTGLTIQAGQTEYALFQLEAEAEERARLEKDRLPVRPVGPPPTPPDLYAVRGRMHDDGRIRHGAVAGLGPGVTEWATTLLTGPDDYIIIRRVKR